MYDTISKHVPKDQQETFLANKPKALQQMDPGARAQAMALEAFRTQGLSDHEVKERNENRNAPVVRRNQELHGKIIKNKTGGALNSVFEAFPPNEN